MSTRTVVDCDRCGKENIEDSYRLEIPVGNQETRKRADLDTKCLGALLQEFVNKLSPEEGREFYAKLPLKKTKTSPVPAMVGETIGIPGKA